jgi:hypothetical protein
MVYDDMRTSTGIYQPITIRYCEAEIRKSNVKLGGFGWFTPSILHLIRYSKYSPICVEISRRSTVSALALDDTFVSTG